MSDSLALYSTILERVRTANPTEDLRRQKVFAWLVVGLLLEQTINVPYLANAIVSTAKAASRERRVQRFLANTHVKVRTYYDGLIRHALNGWAGQALSIAIDTTSLAGRLVICRLALVYRGRAIPLVWQVYDRKSVMLAYASYQPLLEHLLTLLPANAEVVLLGDKGFRTTEIMQFCRDHRHWHFRLRLQGTQYVWLPDRRVLPLADLGIQRGQAGFLHQVHLGNERYGPLNIALAWADGAKTEPWYIATDQPADLTTLGDYGLRMDIDESFRDDKSGGFQLEDCELADPTNVERLLLVMAVATLHLVSLGSYVVDHGERPSVDGHWRRGLSYFQIGWRWLRRNVECAASVLRSLPLLTTGPDPEPVVLPAARRQAPTWAEWSLPPPRPLRPS
ncbi:MAG: hypothetical protein U0822_27320 [Anaerolineae bacterium]